MGCGCGKKKNLQTTRLGSTAPAPASPPNPVTATRPSEPPAFKPLRFYLRSSDGTETVYNTLAEAQSALRSAGGPRSGSVIEPRR